MRVKNVLLAILFFSHVPVIGQISFGRSEKINKNWKFKLGDNHSFLSREFKDTLWKTVNLPHDWSIKGQLSPTLASATGYLPGGIGWYRKTMEIPIEKKGLKVYVYFEGVYNRSEVFVNGKLLGKRPNGYVSFAYDATSFIKFGESNTIAVRVDHSRSADSRWYTGSGIYRDVYIVYSHPIHIGQWGINAFPELTEKAGTLNIEVDVTNDSNEQVRLNVVNELFDGNGSAVGKSSVVVDVETNRSEKISTRLKVDSPELWSLDSPKLYELRTTLFKGDIAIDSATTTTGFRKFTFDPDHGFALNDIWMKLKGVCLHHDAGVLGAAVPREVLKTRLETLKSIGVNAIRTSHNPQAPQLYQLCDELGILVLNEAYDEWEFPKRKWLEGWNVGTPGFEGSDDIFAEWAEKDLEDMVRRDRNHLSVFAWSIGNEVDYPNDPYSHPVLDGGGNTGFSQAFYGGYKKDAPDAMKLGEIATRLVAAVKRHDTSRPVTAGLAGVAMSNETEYPEALDITGYNYTESKYLTDHVKYPERVIYGSENRHDMNAWLAVKNNEHIFGQFLWTGIDYLGESGKWPSRGFNSGLIDFSGGLKPRGYFRKSLWSEKPMIYLGTYAIDSNNANELSIDAWSIWNFTENKNIRAVCYTNTAKARIELDGHIIGKEKPYDPETGIIFWDIPFQKGKLEVIGLDENDQEQCRYGITTSKRPFALITKVKSKVINRDRGIAQIMVEVVDENGFPVTISDDEITVEIKGPAILLGLEAGNNSDMSDYTDNKQRVFQGRLLTYLEASGEPGEINITFSSPWLKPAKIQLESK